MKVLKGLSLLVLVGVVGCQIRSGMYDWHAVTTSDLQHNSSIWVGCDVLLTNVSIRKYDIRERGADTLVALQLANGRTNPPDNETGLWVIGRMSTQEAGRSESLPSRLRNGTRRLGRVRVTIKEDFAQLREYWLPADASWFNTPYLWTVNLTNRFASLRTSVWSGVAVQVLVYGAMAFLVLAGLVHVFPATGD